MDNKICIFLKSPDIINTSRFGILSLNSFYIIKYKTPDINDNLYMLYSVVAASHI